MAEMLLFKCTDITRYKITWISKSPQARRTSDLYQPIHFLAGETGAQEGLAWASAVSYHHVRMGIWVPCLGFLPILPLFIWAQCVHITGINSRRCRKCSLYGSRKPFQQPPKPPSLPLAIEMCVVWDISGGLRKGTSLLLLIHAFSLFRQPYNTGVSKSKRGKGEANIHFNQMFLKHWRPLKNWEINLRKKFKG